MNLRRSGLIAFSLVVVALSVWFFLSGDSGPQITSSDTARIADASVSPSATPGISHNARRYTKEELRSSVFSALNLPSQRDRVREFCELLRSVTVENADIVRDAIQLLRRREGRTPDVAEALLKMHLQRLAKGEPGISMPPRTGDLSNDIKVLSDIPEGAEKMRRFLEILDDIGPTNWRDALAAVDLDITADPLRQARRTMLRAQIGERVGRIAIEETMRNKVAGADVLARAWSASNPAAALAWIDEVTDQKEKLSFVSWVASGICSTDPHRAWTLLSTFPEDLRIGKIDYLIYQLSEESGFRAAEAFYSVVRTDPRASSMTVRKAFYRLAQTREFMLAGGTAQEAAAALDWLSASIPADMQPSVTFINAAARVDPKQTRIWLDEHRDRLDPGIATQAYRYVAHSWRASSPDTLRAWLEANPTHPLQDAMTAIGPLRSNASSDGKQSKVTP